MKKLLYAASLILLLSLNAPGKDASFLFRPDGANFYVYGYGQNTFILNQSRITSFNLDKQMAQLSTGKRINSASDDPSGFAVAEKMSSLLNQLSRESMNAEDMRNFHNAIESAAAEDQNILQRIRLLIIQASSGIFTAEDRELIQTEISQMLNQVNMNAKFSQFNKINIIPELTAENLGLDGVDVLHNPENSIGLVDEAMTKLTRKRIIQGIKSNVLTFQIDGKSCQYLNLQRSESNISDLDMAEGISNLIKNSVVLKVQHGLIIRSK